MSRVAILGAGSMGTAIARGLRAAGWSPDDIRLCVRRAEHAETLTEDGFWATTDVGAAAQGADIVVLASKPKDIAELLASVTLDPSQVVLSVAAGVTIAAIADRAAGNPIVRAMPNTPATLQQGATGFARGPGVSDDDTAIAREVLEAVGLAIEVDEAQINAVTAVSGSGPAYAFLLAEAMAGAGVELGLSAEVASELAAHTIRGAGAMLVQGLVAGDLDAAGLREQVTSPAGTTAAALDVLADADFEKLISRALRAARDRADELGR